MVLSDQVTARRLVVNFAGEELPIVLDLLIKLIVDKNLVLGEPLALDLL